MDPVQERALLEREIDVLWGTDDCGRMETAPLLAVPAPGPGTDEEPPATFPRERSARTELRRCRSFVLDEVGSAPVPPGFTVVDSDDPVPDLVRCAEQWQIGEWTTLMSGAWGPWAAAVDGGRQVVALCFSSRLIRRGAEAGVWTDPDHRGRGLALAVTARWAALVAEQTEVVYYSARPDNAASLAVARRLGARPIGTIWQLWPTRAAG